jgi:hypothetical protein
MLLVVNKQHARVEVDVIDKIISGEIPDQATQPRLYELVKKFMVHGPCDYRNQRSPCCQETGKCRANFPKRFCEETLANNEGYPEYRRRDDGRTMTVGEHEIDNRWIVPYNPYLLLKYNCHINVEVCASVKSFKYLYKYIFKGHDVALMQVRSLALRAAVSRRKRCVNFHQITR